MDFKSEGIKGTSNPQRRPGDWVCSECGQLNFKSRNKCFRGCAVFRPVESSTSGGGGWGQFDQGWRERDRGFDGNKTDVWGRPVKAMQERRPGDWICPECNFLNYTSRQQCHRCELKKPQNAENKGHAFNSRGGMYPGPSGPSQNSGGSMYFCPNCPLPCCNRSSTGAGMGNSFMNPYRQNSWNPYPNGGFQPLSGGDRRPGDWDCPSCRGHNYADKKACFKCGIPKPKGVIEESNNRMPFPVGNFQRRNNFGGSERRPGDWDCPSCNAHNYASKISCFICKKPKPENIEKTTTGGFTGGDRRPGDWDCPECNAHNYASKRACFKCQISKPEDV